MSLAFRITADSVHLVIGTSVYLVSKDEASYPFLVEACLQNSQEKAQQALSASLFEDPNIDAYEWTIEVNTHETDTFDEFEMACAEACAVFQADANVISVKVVNNRGTCVYALNR